MSCKVNQFIPETGETSVPNDTKHCLDEFVIPVCSNAGHIILIRKIRMVFYSAMHAIVTSKAIRLKIRKFYLAKNLYFKNKV